MTLFSGEKLKQLRKKRNLTQQQLAYMVGCTNLAISRYERSQYTPRPDRLHKLAEALMVDTRELFPGETEQVPQESREQLKKRLIKELLQIDPDLRAEVLGFVRGYLEGQSYGSDKKPQLVEKPEEEKEDNSA